MHGIVGELMDASNFYIALYDDEREMINFPYFVDEFDLEGPGPEPLEPFGVGDARGTTAYLLRVGEPLLIGPERFQALIDAGELELLGVRGQEWLGRPAEVGGRMLGVVSCRPTRRTPRLTSLTWRS